MNRIKIAFSDFSPRPMRGQFSMKVYRRGRLMKTYSDHNLIVTGAKTAIASLLAGQGTGKAITSIGFGTNGSVPVPEDTELTDAFVKPVTSMLYDNFVKSGIIYPTGYGSRRRLWEGERLRKADLVVNSNRNGDRRQV
jgi:hypothetical protein